MSNFVCAEISPKVLAEIFEKNKNAIVQVNFLSDITGPFASQGSKYESNTIGVVIADSGVVMIGDHIFPNTTFSPTAKVEGFEVVLSDESKVKAKFLGKDEDAGVAFIQIEEREKFPKKYLKFSEEELKLGDEVISITTLNKEENFAKVFNGGYVNGILTTPKNFASVFLPSIDTNLGAPVISMKTGLAIGVISGTDLGRLVSHNTLIKTTSHFANSLKEIPKNPEESNTKAWLGIETQPLTKELAIYWGIEEREGIVISTIIEDSPADEAGLSEGDIVTSINSVKISVSEDYEIESFRNLIRQYKPNETAIFTVIRDGEDQIFNVKFGDIPKSSFFAEEYKNDEFGISVVEITFDLRRTFNLESSAKGVYVADVEPASWVSLAGISLGDVIQKVNSDKIENVTDFKNAIAKVIENKDEEVTFFALRGVGTILFLVKTEF
ncbi:MAG: PDZ domain-containing protein [Calditrichaeota bacterium]|nr:MAG: PDZ domain-containing protein [Calditrichota bacterium]